MELQEVEITDAGEARRGGGAPSVCRVGHVVHNMFTTVFSHYVKTFQCFHAQKRAETSFTFQPVSIDECVTRSEPNRRVCELFKTQTSSFLTLSRVVNRENIHEKPLWVAIMPSRTCFLTSR